MKGSRQTFSKEFIEFALILRGFLLLCLFHCRQKLLLLLQQFIEANIALKKKIFNS